MDSLFLMKYLYQNPISIRFIIQVLLVFIEIFLMLLFHFLHLFLKHFHHITHGIGGKIELVFKRCEVGFDFDFCAIIEQ